jgi:hypothetical protein
MVKKRIYIPRTQLSTRLYDKIDDFNVAIINFPHSNKPTAPVYGVYISQLVRYASACNLYSDFLQCLRIPITKLLIQGFL